MPEDEWLFEVALIGMLEHPGVRKVVETQAMQLSLNDRQWRDFEDKNDVSWLSDGPHGDELGVMRMASVRAGCVLLMRRRVQSVAEYGSRRSCLTRLLKSMRRCLRDLVPWLYMR